MTTGQALIRLGLDATAAVEVLRDSTNVTPGTRWLRNLSLADHEVIVGALRFTTQAVYTKKGGLLARTVGAIEARQAHYEGSGGEAGRRLVVALSTVSGLTSHALAQAGRAKVGPAFDVVRADVRKLAARHSPAAESAPRRSRLIVARIAEATALINQFAGAIDPDDGVIDDIVTGLGCGSDIVLALKAVCFQEADLVNSAYAAAGIGREATRAFETLTAAWKALNAAQRTLSDATEQAKAPAKREAELLAATG